MTRDGRGHLLLGLAIIAGTAGLFLLGRHGLTAPAAAFLTGAALLGALLFRFALPRPWMTVLALASSVIAGFVLLTGYGPIGVAWIFGLAGGSNIGAGWRAARKRR